MNTNETAPRNVGAITQRIWTPSDNDLDAIKKAYQLACKAHKGQQRYSGRPYVHHVIETAIILAELGMDVKTIIAGLLHDTIEDADVSPETISEQFDDEVLFLVQGVTKLGKVRYQGMKRHIESLRKLFVATSRDIRVLIIKLADRLHNMKTLEHVPERKQGRIAEETLEVYAPIAHRLGIGKLHSKLQDLAFPFVYPDEYQQTKQLSKEKYNEAVTTIEKIRKKLLRLLKEKEGYENVTVDYRLKGLYSLYQKLERKDMNIDEVYDIVALRVIVDSVEDCYQVLGIINSQWQPLSGRLKDYIASPKPNGYRSLHTTIFSGDGSIAEVQIRTHNMHKEAEYGIASHANYKSNNEQSRYLEWFDDLVSKMHPQSDQEDQAANSSVPTWVSELANHQKEISDPATFMRNLKTDFFEDRIFVFTPDGDVIDLPEGASPIDFAYQVHTEIGHHAAGAKVNNKMASLDTVLENGDIVKITTSSKQEPSRKWLEYAKTTLARRQIQNYIQPN